MNGRKLQKALAGLWTPSPLKQALAEASSFYTNALVAVLVDQSGPHYDRYKLSVERGVDQLGAMLDIDTEGLNAWLVEDLREKHKPVADKHSAAVSAGAAGAAGAAGEEEKTEEVEVVPLGDQAVSS